MWLIEWIHGMDVDSEVSGHSREIGGSRLILGSGHGDMLPRRPSEEGPVVQP